MKREKLVNEIPLRAHNLHAIIARLLRARGGDDEVVDLLFDAFFIQLFWWEGRDRGFYSARRDALRAVSITSGMQDLHRDLAVSRMDAVRDNLVVGDVLIIEQASSAGENAALFAGGHAARYDQRGLTACAICVELCDTVPVFAFLEAGVHRPHQHAVFQRGKAKIKGG